MVLIIKYNLKRWEQSTIRSLYFSSCLHFTSNIQSSAYKIQYKLNTQTQIMRNLSKYQNTNNNNYVINEKMDKCMFEEN